MGRVAMDEETGVVRLMERLVMDVKELQDALRISRRFAYELTKQDGFPSFKIGKKVLIDRAGLERWMKEQQEKKGVFDGN